MSEKPTVDNAIKAIRKAADEAYEDGTFVVDGLTYGHLPIGPALMIANEVERLREALTEAPMRALGQTNGAFAWWCMDQVQPPAPAEVPQ
jgi:hypothetical protein